MVAEWARPRGCVEDEVEAMCLPEDQEDTIVARVTSCLVDKLAGILVMISGMDWSSTEEKDVDVSMDFSGGKNCKKSEICRKSCVY